MAPFTFQDISSDLNTRYAIQGGERRVFFLGNRSGEIVFRLEGRDAEVHVYAAFSARGEERFVLSITQEHAAPDTRSSLAVRSVLGGTARVELDAVIRIEENAGGSEAAQDGRALLLDSGASQKMRPALEISPEDVTCRHAAAIAPINPEALFMLRARGLPEERATDLLARGFLFAPLSEFEKRGTIEDMRAALRTLDTNLS